MRSGLKRAGEALGQTAWAYRKLNQQDKARSVYQYVVENWPKKDRAIFSQRGIILCSIALEDYTGAGEYYRRKGNLVNARHVHQYVVEHFPAGAEALLSQRNVILCSIGLNDEAQIKTGIETLLTQFAQDQNIAAVVGYVADRLGDSRDDAKLRLYQYIVDEHPEDELVVPAKARVGQIMLGRGDEKGAEALFQKTLADYKGHPRLAEAVHLMAEGYYEQAVRDRKQNPGTRVGDHYLKAIAK